MSPWSFGLITSGEVKRRRFACNQPRLGCSSRWSAASAVKLARVEHRFSGAVGDLELRRL
jgi:hypothetical protein